MSEGREHIYAQLREAGFDWPVLEIKRLEAEVEQAKSRSIANWNLAIKTKAKLAAIEGVQRYKVTAVHLAIKAVTEERKFSDGDWIKAADIDAILRGEDT